MPSSRPTVTVSGRQISVADHFYYLATVTYPGEEPGKVRFESTLHGGPIVMVSNGIPGGVFIADRVLDRIGRTLDPEWVLRFFGVESPVTQDTP